MKRTITSREEDEFLDLCKKFLDNPKVKTIRVYSFQGFVPNSYRYPCPIEYAQATRQGNGQWIYSIGTCDAKRPFGRGPLITINGRAYND